MIRITGSAPECWGGGPLQDLHPFVDYQCCAAVSHLQHQVEIPNSWPRKVARIANFNVRLCRNALISLHFHEWHGSCSDKNAKILPTE
jgi:hypothetical protein